MQKKIIIVGSNGVLGKFITDKAIKLYGIDNIVLSDYKEKRLILQKEQLENFWGSMLSARVINANSKQSIANGLRDVNLVIIAIQQKEPLIQKYCIEKDINSIDVSINPEFLKQVLKLNSEIKNGSLHIVAGGMFPGLSGIMAKNIAENSNSNEPTNIALLQSSNGTNGETGLADMLKIFEQKVKLIESHSTTEFAGFSFKKSFTFPKPFNTKKLRLANFVERDYLKSNGVISNFWTGFDKERLNIIIGLLRKIGFLKLFRTKLLGNVLSSFFSKQNNGNEIIGLKAENKNKEIILTLISDYEGTASCVMAFTKQIFRKRNPENGVKFPFELFTFQQIEPELQDVIIYKSN